MTSVGERRHEVGQWKRQMLESGAQIISYIIAKIKRYCVRNRNQRIKYLFSATEPANFESKIIRKGLDREHSFRLL